MQLDGIGSVVGHLPRKNEQLVQPLECHLVIHRLMSLLTRRTQLVF